jgi:uncharacterized membrane protein YGL010W
MIDYIPDELKAKFIAGILILVFFSFFLGYLSRIVAEIVSKSMAEMEDK